MKCKSCKKRMRTDFGETTIQMDAGDIKVINIPIFVCPSCGESFIHDIVIRRAEAYVGQFGADEKDKVLDFRECEEQETADTIVTMTTLGIM